MIGTSVDAIDEASDRERFEAFASRIGVRMPRGEICRTPDEVRHAADAIGLPILVRPSYVLGGRGMEILSSHAQVEAYLDEAWMTSDRPLLVDEYLGHAIEVDVDAHVMGPRCTSVQSWSIWRKPGSTRVIRRASSRPRH